MVCLTSHRHRVALVGAALSAALCGALDLPIAADDGAVAVQGFAPLFDGRTLTGWALVGPGEWTVEDGVLTGQGARGVAVLRSARTFRNLVLRAELRAEGGAETSLGIRCPERDAAPATVRSCYRVSLNDDHALFPTGSLVDYARARVPQKTMGEWTRVEITADGPRIAVRVNGAVTAEVRDERLVGGTIAIETPQRGRVRVRRIEAAPVGAEGGR
jgi:hypothetical protein